MKELRRILYSLLCVCLLSTLIVIKHKSDSTPNSYSSNNEINTTDNSTDVLLEAHNTTKAKELYKKISPDPYFEDEFEHCDNCPKREICHKLSYCAMEEY